MQTKKIGSLFAYFFVIFLDSFGFSITFILFAPLFLDPSFDLVSASTSLSMKHFLLGIAFLAFPLFQFFGAPILGDIADLIGRKKTLYVSTLGLCFGFILSAIAISAHTKILLILSRALCGFFAGNLSISLAGVADLSHSEKERGKNFGYVTALMGIGWIGSMIFSGFISNAKIFAHALDGPIIVFWANALLAFINFMVVFLYLKETHQTSVSTTKIRLLAGIKNLKEAFLIHDLKWLFLAVFLWYVGWGSGIQWLQIYAVEHYAVNAFVFTIFMIFMGISWISGSSFVNTISLKFFPSKTLAVTGMSVVSLLLILQVAMPSFMAYAIVYCIAAVFASFTLSNTLNLISLQASEDIQGSTMGLSQSMQALGWIGGSLLSTLIFEITSWIFFPVIACITTLTAFLVAKKATKAP